MTIDAALAAPGEIRADALKLKSLEAKKLKGEDLTQPSRFAAKRSRRDVLPGLPLPRP